VNIISVRDTKSVKKNFYTSDDIKDISFEIGFYHSHFKVYQLKTKEKYVESTMVYKHDPSVIQEYDFFSITEIKPLFNNIFSIVRDWRFNYSNVMKKDGVVWELKITYNDGQIIDYAGDSHYPDNFSDLLDVFGLDLDKAFI